MSSEISKAVVYPHEPDGEIVGDAANAIPHAVGARMVSFLTKPRDFFPRATPEVAAPAPNEIVERLAMHEVATGDPVLGGGVAIAGMIGSRRNGA